MKLTFSGEKYLEHARTVMMQIDNMEREIRDITNHQTGRLRLGFPNERIIYMLPALLPVFHEKYPGVRIETNNAPGVRCWIFWQPVMWILYFTWLGEAQRDRQSSYFP